MKPQGTQLSLFETRSSSDPFAVRISPRARRLTARVHVGGRVEIVVPVGVNAHTVRDFVRRFTPWIDRKVAAMQSIAAPSEPVPKSVEFRLHAARASQWIGAGRRGAASQRPAAGSWCRRRTSAARAPVLQRLAQGAPPTNGWRRGCCSWPRDLNYPGGARLDPLPAHALGQLLDARHGEPELLAALLDASRWCAICSSTSWRTPGI